MVVDPRYAIPAILFQLREKAMLTSAQFISNLVPYLIRVNNTGDFLASLCYVVVATGVAIGGVACGLVIKQYAVHS